MGYFRAMFNKVPLYGLAFGSMSAAMVLIQYANGLYRERTFVSAIPVLANILLPALGVFLFIKSISMLKTDKPINLGKALFGALLVCVIVAICNIGAYQHIMFNRKDVMADYKGLNYLRIEQFYGADSSIKATEKAAAITKAKENFDDNISTGSWGKTQFMMCLSTGLVVALLTFAVKQRKQQA